MFFLSFLSAALLLEGVRCYNYLQLRDLVLQAEKGDEILFSSGSLGFLKPSSHPFALLPSLEHAAQLRQSVSSFAGGGYAGLTEGRSLLGNKLRGHQ